MTIEEAIKQKKPFRNLYNKTAVNLIYSKNWLDEQHRGFYKSFNLTNKQFNVLRILKGASGPISTSNIKERLVDRNSDASRVVDRLAKKKLIEKKANPTDRRLVDVTLTKTGEQLLQRIAKKEDQLGSTLSNLTIEEANQLNNLLDKMRG